MLNDLIKQLYSAWHTFDIGKVDYESKLFIRYKDKFLTEAVDSVSKTKVLIEMASDKLAPDAAMLTELIKHLATDAKKTNDIAIYIRIEQMYNLFCLLFVSNDELHKVSFTALKEGNLKNGTRQIRTLKNYSEEMKQFFESENTRINKSHQQANKSERGEKPQHKKMPTNIKPQHKQCPNPKLQTIINLFPSPLFNKKIYSNFEESVTIHVDEFKMLSLADMKTKYYNFLYLPTALNYPAVHDQVIVNLLGEKHLDWDLIFAIYNNAYTNFTSASKDVLFRIFKRLCEVGKHEIALEVFKTHKAIINIDNYFRMLHSMEPNKEGITVMLELGLTLNMYLPNVTLMEYYLQKYGLNSKISKHIKDSVYSENVKSSRTTIDLHGAPKNAVEGIIEDVVENWEDEETKIVVSHGGGTHVAFGKLTPRDMNDVQFFSPVKNAVYEAVRCLQYKWQDKYIIRVSPYWNPKGYMDGSNSVISKRTIKNEPKKITIFESTQQNKQRPGEIGKVNAPVNAITAIHSSLQSSDNNVIFTTTTSVTQEDLTSNASQPKTTGKMNPKAVEYKPKSGLYNPPVETSSTHFRTKEEKSPTQPTMESPYMAASVTPSFWYPSQAFFAYCPTYQPTYYYTEHFEDEIKSETETKNHI
ncbi:hypothetical protein [Legionella sp. WA2024007413]